MADSLTSTPIAHTQAQCVHSSKVGCTIVFLFAASRAPLSQPNIRRDIRIGGNGKKTRARWHRQVRRRTHKAENIFVADRRGPVDQGMFPNGVILYNACHPHDGQWALAQPCCSQFILALSKVQESGMGIGPNIVSRRFIPGFTYVHWWGCLNLTSCFS